MRKFKFVLWAFLVGSSLTLSACGSDSSGSSSSGKVKAKITFKKATTAPN